MWTNQISTQTSASKTITIVSHPVPVAEMERSRVALITLAWVLFSRISGAKVEMRVRPGDDVTLYSDCVYEKFGINTVWIRNCSHELQPPLIISATDFIHGALPRYSFLWNPSNQTHDLLVKNVSESDLGLYYCAVHEKVVTKDLPQTTSNPSVSDCSVCWKLLVSLCPVCVLLSSLLSSTCAYCICTTRTKAEESSQEWWNKIQSQKSRTTDEVEGDEVCYTSLDVPTRGQKHLKNKKRVESFDFSTYSEVKTDQI
ncbi:hypothetical protein AOLI_G00198460 [Acnodon oligacanthus]